VSSFGQIGTNFHATRAARRGLLGHSNVGMTFAFYCHIAKQMDREAVDCMEEMLSTAGF
jgi:uncharacterized protein (DUF486 family)